MRQTHILIVEDEYLIARDIQAKLSRLGWVATLASSGPAALQAADESRPDLVLMDIRLGREMDGIETAAQLRARHDIPVVYLTAYADEDTVQRARATQPVGYIHKPLTVEGLRTAIEIGLDRHQQERDIRMLYDQLCVAHARLRMFAREVMDRQESERQHVALELEDKVGQVLVSARLNLAQAQTTVEQVSLTQRMTEGIEMVRHALLGVTRLIDDLRPPSLNYLGLIPTLQWYLDGQAKSTGYAVELIADPSPAHVPAEIEAVCFRVVQEAATNIARHARAQHVRVEMRPDAKNGLELIVRDDGVGFDVPAALKRAVDGHGMGLLWMQERVELAGGQFQIRSVPGQGTEIVVRLPLLSEDPSGPLPVSYPAPG